jgi:hypothetical protein
MIEKPPDWGNLLFMNLLSSPGVWTVNTFLDSCPANKVFLNSLRLARLGDMGLIVFNYLV